jgi:hypothetical protein
VLILTQLIRLSWNARRWQQLFSAFCQSVKRGYCFSPTKCVVVSQNGFRHRLYGKRNSHFVTFAVVSMKNCTPKDGSRKQRKGPTHFVDFVEPERDLETSRFTRIFNCIVLSSDQAWNTVCHCSSWTQPPMPSINARSALYVISSESCQCTQRYY